MMSSLLSFGNLSKGKPVTSLTTLDYETLPANTHIPLVIIPLEIPLPPNHRTRVLLIKTNDPSTVRPFKVLGSLTHPHPDRLSDGPSQRNSESPSMRTTESLSHEASSSSNVHIHPGGEVTYFLVRTRSPSGSKRTFTRSEGYPGCIYAVHGVS